MKFLVIVILLFSLPALSDVFVKGYFKSDGTYVKPHYRSDPNSSVMDNWSTRGNVNPYTGEEGYKNPNQNFQHNSNQNYQSEYKSSR